MRREDTPIIIVPSCLNTHEGQCDCDCACAVTSSTALSPHPSMVGQLRASTAAVAALPLQDNWLAYLTPQGPSVFLVANKPAVQILHVFKTPQTIETIAKCHSDLPRKVIQETVYQLLCSGLLSSVPAVAALTVPSKPTVLSAWMHITDSCNLACPYCYVHKRSSEMSKAIGQSAVSSLMAAATKYGYEILKLKYAGGEPTLNFLLVRRLHTRAVLLARNAGIELETVLLTNGVNLTRDMLGFLSDSGIRLMVSLDGGPLAHAHQRICRDGQNTYVLVVNAIEHALALGIVPDISITLTALNLQDAKEAVRFALDHTLPFTLNFYRARNEMLNPNLVPQTESLIAAILDTFDLIGNYPHYPRPLTGILDRIRLDVPHSYPCSAGRDYVVVNPNGTLSACQMLLGSPDSMLSAEDPLREMRLHDRQRFPSVESISQCQGCLWRFACAGGCPLLRNSSLHSLYCQVYRAVLPELVKLEGRRLLTNFISSEIASV